MTTNCTTHNWHPVIWRCRNDQYQRGCICLNCPSHIWLDENWKEAWPDNWTKTLPEDQWQWWLDRIAGREITKWPIPESRNRGPFGHSGPLPDELPWSVHPEFLR